MPRPPETPIGLALAQTAKAVQRAFDDALAEVGGSRPVWLILLTLRISPPQTQSELAKAVDIREATLTHHLHAMEADGLVTRTRNPANRRVQVVELTELGQERFEVLRGAAQAHDRRLHAGLSADDLSALRSGLGQLRANVDD